MIKLLIEVLLIAVSIMLSVFQQVEWYVSIIIAMLSFIVVELISQKIRHELLFSGVNSYINKVHDKLKDIVNNVQLKVVHDDLESSIKRIQHPYFSKLFSDRLEAFIQDNKSLFNGDHYTSPFSNETYGAEGLLDTKKSLKCISSFEDYWSDRGNCDYYPNQLKLIAEGKKIQRLFVVTESNRKLAEKEGKKQKDDGIEVRIIEKKKFGDDGFFRDYLIQDDTLLVDLIPKDSNNPSHKDSKEKITINGVKERVREFNKYWSHATKTK